MIRARRITTTAILAGGALLLLLGTFAWPSGSGADQLLVADLRGHALLILNPTDPDAVQRIDLPGLGLSELLRLDDGRVVVSLEQSGALAVVDLESGHVDTVEVGGIPHGLTLSDGLVLVTDRASDIVRRFDPADWSERESIPVEAWPHAVVVTPSGAIAVASARAGALTVGDHHYATGAVTETVAVSSDGHLATASAFDGIVTLLDSEGAVEARYQVGGRPVRVAFSPDGTTLAAALSADHGVAIIADGQVRRLPVSGVPDGLAFSRDGRYLYASDVVGGAVTAIEMASGRIAAVIPVGQATGALLVLGH